MRHFNYPVKLTPQKEGGFLVEFPDLPEAITQGDSEQEALEQAADCLEEAIANRIEMKLDIPEPRQPKKKQFCVSLPATLVAKTALYLIMRDRSLSNMALAKKLHCDEKEIRRLLDPHYSSKFPRLEQALQVLGQHLNVMITNDQEVQHHSSWRS
jgi:antitoxin HicB